MTSIEKGHDTGLRILEILKILLENDADRNTIIEKLKQKDDIPQAYTYEAYLKYFNTLEALGFNISRLNDLFCLNNALVYADLSKNEERLLAKLIEIIPRLNNSNQENIIKKLFLRINKYVKKDLKSELNNIENKSFSVNQRNNLVNTLKQLMEEKSEINISFTKNGRVEEIKNAAIKKIIEDKEKFYIMCFNAGMIRSRKICVDLILSIKRSPKQVCEIEISNTVVFELYGRLAKSYKLKEWEILEDFGNNFARVINTKEDYDTLLLRLLKYGENCKIIRPVSLRDNFLSLADDVLKNLEDEVCQK